MSMAKRGRRRLVDPGSERRPVGGVGVTTGADGDGGVFARARKYLFGSIIGVAVVASVTAWLDGFLDTALRDVLPSGGDAFCTFRETVEDHWPFAAPPTTSDRFTILIATVDRDDADHTYTRAVARAFLKQDGVERVATCRVLKLSEIG